ncbi:DUF1631 domain-containing protein [Sulfuriferula thiophila]|uniref:DUF1631 domain-containing protein n=1 Tax=Sulfuriferula thiophila TaxID=1781211 RepID=UPI000F607A4E|nr:DUF1631 domain-containing protein [Sulfuriferula thiophila]
MIENSQRNVVSLSQFDKTRNILSPAEVLILLNECRDRMINEIDRVWNDKRDQIEDDLLNLADRSPILENRNLYYLAQGLLRNRNESLTAALRKQFVSSFDALVRGGVAAEPSGLSSAFDMSLSLVDEQAFEETLVVSKSAARMQVNSVEELAALEQRVAALLHQSQVRTDINPFAPKILCESFLAACSALEVEPKVRLILLQHFDAHIAPVLPGIYQGINQYLVEKGVLPSIKVGMTGTRERQRSTTKINSASVAPQANTGAADALSAESADMDVFALLQQLLSRQMPQSGAGSGYWAPIPVSGQGAVQSGTLQAGQQSISAAQIAALTLLQRGQFAANVATTSFDPALIQAGTTNVLRDIRDAGLVQVDNHVDSFTIDIVAMLFDYVLDDENIPAALKALIGRLQIPVLKVAMLDRQFFSKKSHPARRLLDEIASVSVGWTDVGAYNTALYAKIDEIVQSVLNDYADDAEIFETLLNNLQFFIDSHEGDVQTAVDESAQIIETSERAQVAQVVVQDEVNRAVDAQVVPDSIAEFVRTIWQQVLQHVYTHEGGQSPAWQASLKTMQDLLWSVTPKLNTEDRLALVAMLPELLKQLRDGMNLIQVESSRHDAIFAGLVACHAVAVKAGLQARNIAPEADEGMRVAMAEQSNVEMPPLPVIESVDAVSEHFDFPADPVDAVEEDEYTEQARDLKKGMWLEFVNKDGSKRTARLSWVSSLRGIYLFTNNQGLDAITITLPRLAARLRDGEARMIKTSSLTERAVERLIGKLQGR